MSGSSSYPPVDLATLTDEPELLTPEELASMKAELRASREVVSMVKAAAQMGRYWEASYNIAIRHKIEALEALN